MKILALLFLLTSCNSFIKLIEGDEYYKKIDPKSGVDHFSIIFSHNINGETHPCGCRHFPLGGLAQVSGLFHKLEKEKSFIYVDSGDTFFESNSLNEYSEKSKKFTAHKLRDALNDLGLKYYVPGDQDFAAGLDFLQNLMEKAKFEILVANIKGIPEIKTWSAIKVAEKTVFITGIMNPSLYNDTIRNNLVDPSISMKAVIQEMQAKGYQPTNSAHHLFLISHGGMEFDEKLAKEFPQIDWIIGSHTQNFNKFPNVVDQTKISQVLSRNHYMGEIQIPLGKDQKDLKYVTHEIRDELKDEQKDNPFIGFLDTYKSEVKQIQLDEEKKFSFSSDQKYQFTTAQTCISCHEPQSDKWKSTAHSLAYMTLINANEEANPSCISCHSVGHNEKGGFKATTELVIFDNEVNEKKLKDYWSAFQKIMPKTSSIRDMNPKKRVQLIDKWLEHDHKLGVSHNFANVQCLNCHQQSGEHPFEQTKIKLSKAARTQNMKNQCLNCHTPDQSPEWYEKTSGTARPIDSVLVEQIKKVACPLNSEG